MWWVRSKILTLILSSYFGTINTQQTCNTGTGTISVPLQNITLIDGTIRWGAAISMGTPPQNLAFWPAANKANDTIIYSTGQAPCNNATSENCVANRGGEFNVSASSTWISESDATHAGAAPSDAAIPSKGDNFGQDILHINSSVALKDFPFVIQSGEDLSFNVLGLATNSTLLTRLYQTGIIASRSWGLFWGLNGLDSDAQKEGSLTFGGYDKAKLTGTGSKINLTHDNPNCNLLVTATSIKMNFPNGTDLEILSTGSSDATLTMCVNPEFPIVTLPYDIWTNFQDNAGGTYLGRSFGINGYGELYSVDDVYAGDLTITLGDGSESVSVRIPNNQLIQPEIKEDDDGVQFYNISTREIAIDSLQDINLHDLPLLGQTFLTSAYLFVEPDKNQFTVWQADPTSDEDVIPQVEAGSSFCTSSVASATVVAQTSTPTSTGNSTGVQPTDNSSTNTGAIAGGVVGGVAAIAIIAVIAFFLLRRRRKQPASDSVALAPMMPEKHGDYYAPGSENPSPNDSVNGGNKYNGRVVQELGSGDALRPELGGEQRRSELGTEDVRTELAAGEGRNHDADRRYELQ